MVKYKQQKMIIPGTVFSMVQQRTSKINENLNQKRGEFDFKRR